MCPSSFSGDLQQALSAVREDIDRIDHQIVDLIAQRLQKVRHVAEQKIQQGLVFRARREIQKMQTLQRLAKKHHIPEMLIFDIWRALMSRAAYQQRPFELLCLGVPELLETARVHFGQDVPIAQAKSLAAMLDTHQQSPDSVMCLISQSHTDWWQAVAARDNLQIVAELPWRAGAAPEAYLLADCPVDLEANADVLYILHGAEQKLVRVHDEQSHASLAALQQKYTQTLQDGTSMQWLGRLPNFHTQQPKD